MGIVRRGGMVVVEEEGEGVSLKVVVEGEEERDGVERDGGHNEYVCVKVYKKEVVGREISLGGFIRTVERRAERVSVRL